MANPLGFFVKKIKVKDLSLRSIPPQSKMVLTLIL